MPWAVPVVIVSLNWRWIFDDLSGFLNNFLITFHLTQQHHLLAVRPRAWPWAASSPSWCGRARRFYSMTFLAGLQAIPKELYEAAEIDGASVVQQFFYVTVPRPQDDLPDHGDAVDHLDGHESPVRVHPHAGAARRAARRSFRIWPIMTALGARRLGMGAAVSLVFFPVLVVLIVLLTRRMLAAADD